MRPFWEILSSELKDELEEGEMAVLYINGHFSTVTKHGDFLYGVFWSN